MKKQRGLGIVPIILILAAVIAAAAGYRSWSKSEEKKAEIAAYEKERTALRNQVDKWQDAMKLAGSTSRIALAGPVKSMQDIRRETSTIKVSKCLTPAMETLSSGMDHQINGFLQFMQGSEHEDAASDSLKSGTAKIVKTMEMIETCKPVAS